MDDKQKFTASMEMMEAAEICAKLECNRNNLKLCLQEISINKWGPRDNIIITDVIETQIAQLKQLHTLVIDEIIQNQNKVGKKLAQACGDTEFMGFMSTAEAGEIVGSVADAAILSIGKMTEEALKKMDEKKP